MAAARLASLLLEAAKLTWLALSNFSVHFKPATLEPKMNERAALLEAYVGSAFDKLEASPMARAHHE